MRILRSRLGFQADHSSSSYLFYAVDGEVSAAGQRVAHRFSSSADVDEQFARYQKWGDYELSSEAYSALLGKYYDVMVSESYDSWTLMIAVPKTPQMAALLQQFHDLDDGEFVRLDIHDYGKRLAVEVFCEFGGDCPLWQEGEDVFEELVESLAVIRSEIMQGNVSFLHAVAEFYGLGAEEVGEDIEEEQPSSAPPEDWSKAELLKECSRRGLPFRKSWTKDQLRESLATPLSRPPATRHRGKPPRLSRAASRIVQSLERR